jgi:biotin carboxyl carrier protein
MKYLATVDGRDFEIDVDIAGEVTVEAAVHAVDLQPIDGAHLYSLVLDHASHELYIERRDGVYYILIEGDRYAVDVEQERLKRLRAMGTQPHEERGVARVVAPMPGLVVKVGVAVGDCVAEGDGLVIVEAMKMENEIRCPRPGVVTAVNIAVGDKVNLGDVLMVVEPEG